MNFKVAASDFDGTLFREQKISASDLAAIRAWRAIGNLWQSSNLQSKSFSCNVTLPPDGGDYL